MENNFDNSFIETVVKRKLTFREVCIRAGIILLGVLVFSLSAILNLAPLGIIIGGWFSWFFVNGRRIEWEYSLKGRVLDIYRITAKSRRRKMIPLELDRLEKFGKVGDREYEHQLNIKTRVLDLTSLDNKKHENWYYAVVQRPKGRFMVIIEPEDFMLQQMMLYIPRFL